MTELFTGDPAPTVVGQIGGPKAQQIEEAVVDGAGLAGAVKTALARATRPPPLADSPPGTTAANAAENAGARGLGGRVLTAAEQDEFATFGKRARATGLTENPNRTGSWGKIGENGKFKEVTRVDVGEAGKPGYRGKTHIHVEGEDGHLDMNTKIPGE
jgi:hypothetical protein